MEIGGEGPNRLCCVAYAKTSSVIQLFGPGQWCVFPALGCGSGERHGRRGGPDRGPLGAYPLFGVGFHHFVVVEYGCAAFPALYFTNSEAASVHAAPAIAATSKQDGLFLLIFGLGSSATAQQPSSGKKDDFASVNVRGDQGMGFSHEKTTHHFHLLADGGTIEIKSNEPTDADSQEAIRQHLAMIAVKFPPGDFAIPLFIHATVPPGVETMKQLKSKITYEAENTVGAAQLRIATHDAEALTAIHSFLRFQIQDHQTGDSLEVQKVRR